MRSAVRLVDEPAGRLLKTVTEFGVLLCETEESAPLTPSVSVESVDCAVLDRSVTPHTELPAAGHLFLAPRAGDGGDGAGVLFGHIDVVGVHRLG